MQHAQPRWYPQRLKLWEPDPDIRNTACPARTHPFRAGVSAGAAADDSRRSGFLAALGVQRQGRSLSTHGPV